MALGLLACPTCHGPVRQQGGQVDCDQGCGPVGRWDHGVLRCDIPAGDASIEWYQSIGGTHFAERKKVAFAMSSLDGAVYHHYIQALVRQSPAGVAADVGAGDGRNTDALLDAGVEFVVATDAIPESLYRMRSRMEAEHPQWLERLLLVQCDLRKVPLQTASLSIVLAIEALCYLNEDYASALQELRRLLRVDGQLMLSERDWEGALYTRMLYGGLQNMLKVAESRDMWDGDEAHLVRSRAFTADELAAVVQQAGFHIVERKGVSQLSAVCGYLNAQGRFTADDAAAVPQLVDLLKRLGESGQARRTNVLVARPE